MEPTNETPNEPPSGGVRVDPKVRLVQVGDLVTNRPECFMPEKLPATVTKVVRLSCDDPNEPEPWIQLNGKGGYLPRKKFMKVSA